ncbi:MAG: hypothetical protein VYA21_05125, partial [Verrucomicrobiota bacterium]|nr:hypothetical protein [Verrucomicrobiota bacterium]
LHEIDLILKTDEQILPYQGAAYYYNNADFNPFKGQLVLAPNETTIRYSSDISTSQDFYNLSFASEINDIFNSNDLTQIEADIRSAISGYSIGGRLNRLWWESHEAALYDIYATNDAATIDTAISDAVDAWVLNAQSSSNAGNRLRVTRAQALADKAYADAAVFAQNNPDDEAAQQAYENFDTTANGYLSNLISNQYRDASASAVSMKQAWGNIALDLQSASAQVKAAIDAAEGTDELHPYDADFGGGDNPAADTQVWAVGNAAQSLDTFVYDAFNALSPSTILRPYAEQNYTLEEIADIIIDAYIKGGDYTIESINAAHGLVQDQLKYLNPTYDLSAELWTVGNASQSIDQLVYDIFNALDTENDISRPRN